MQWFFAMLLSYVIRLVISWQITNLVIGLHAKIKSGRGNSRLPLRVPEPQSTKWWWLHIKKNSLVAHFRQYKSPPEYILVEQYMNGHGSQEIKWRAVCTPIFIRQNYIPSPWNLWLLKEFKTILVANQKSLNSRLPELLTFRPNSTIMLKITEFQNMKNRKFAKIN